MYIVLINSATMLDSPVLHFYGKKKKKVIKVNHNVSESDLQTYTLLSCHFINLHCSGYNFFGRVLNFLDIQNIAVITQGFKLGSDRRRRDFSLQEN